MATGVYSAIPNRVALMARWPLVLLAVITAWAGLAVARYGQPVAMGSDESGYLNHARLLRTGRWVGEVRPVAGLPLMALDRGAYQPLGFGTSADRTRQVPNYPLGYPLAVALFEQVVGEGSGALVLAVAMALLLPSLLYRLGRDFGLDAPWAVVAAGWVALSPVTMVWLLVPMSDVYSLLLATALMLTAGWARRGATGWAAGTGVLLAAAVLTRLPNILLLLPVGVLWMGASWRVWLAAVAGGLPGAALLAWHNQVLHGGTVATGYDSLDRLFELSYLLPTLVHFGYWSVITLTPLALLGFLFSPGLAWRGGTESRRRWMVLWSWVGGFGVFYGLYQFSNDNWTYLRFILPAFPALAIGGAVMGQAAVEALRRRGPRWCGSALIALVLVFSAGWLRQANRRLVSYQERAANPFSQLQAWVVAETNPADVIACMFVSGSLYYYTPNPIVQFDSVWDDGWEKVRQAARERGVEIYAAAATFEAADAEALARKIAGDWELVQTWKHLQVYRLRSP